MVRGEIVISFIICANSNWGDYATPFVNSILAQGDKCEVILVDNGSKKPYPPSDKYKLVRLNPVGHYNYTAALNAGAKKATGEWLMFCNDDVLCTGNFTYLEGLDQVGVYGAELRHKEKEQFGADVDYIYGWALLMHRRVWMAVGEFDEYYLHAGFDDLDYCWRAAQAGAKPVEVKPWPFVHLADQKNEKHRRATVEGYRENMARSKEYFLKRVNQ